MIDSFRTLLIYVFSSFRAHPSAFIVRCSSFRAHRFAFIVPRSALIVLLLLFPVFAQKQRPKVLPQSQQQFAARVLLIPMNGRPASWKLPRMLAQVASYELDYPPREMLGDATQPMDVDRILAWARQQDLRKFSGVLIAVDALTADANPDANKASSRLEIINWIRQTAPTLPIYGFAARANDVTSKFVFDDLLFEKNPDNAVALSFTRLINRIHQRPPKVMAILSSDDSPAIINAITSNIEAAGGQLLKTGKADLILFVHTSKRDAIKLATFVETLAKTATAGYYVALADVSGNADSLIAAMRERKLLDLLQAFASSREPDNALSKVVAQASARLITAKVLRPRLEVEQLRRAERAQVELMLTRYLEDWAYAGSIRARVEQHVREQLKADPNNLGAATEPAEAFANAELKMIASEIFRTQFRYNIHSAMMGNGIRADFQVEMLQLFKARFPLQRIDELQLDLSVYLSLLVGINPQPLIKSP